MRRDNEEGRGGDFEVGTLTTRPGRTRGIAAAGLLLLLGISSCVFPVDPPLPPQAIAMEPLAQYRFWWDVTAQCAGTSRSFDEVRWYVVPGVSTFHAGDDDAVGAYYGVGHKIVLAEWATTVPGVVRHEMLHAILRRRGEHPAEYFRVRCAGLVSRIGDCAAEATGRPPDSSAVLVSPSDVRLELQLYPASGELRASDGWIVGLVRVTNARAIPVRVSLRRDGMSYRSFGYADDCGARTALTGAGWLELAAGETRAQAFDHRWCGGHESLLTARGSLGGDSTETRQLLLRR